MNAPQISPIGHSADVRIHLHLNGSGADGLPIAQLGPKFLVLRTPIDYPPCEAEIVMAIDGQETRWGVHLVNGLRIECWKTPLTCCVDGDT